MNDKRDDKAPRFAVLAEVDGRERPLFAHGLSFGELYENVVRPYERGEVFWLDGVRTDAKTISRLKIVEQYHLFEHHLGKFFSSLTGDDVIERHQATTNYYLVLDSLSRTYAKDVTSEVVMAPRKTLGEKLGEWASIAQMPAETLGRAAAAFVAIRDSLS